MEAVKKKRQTAVPKILKLQRLLLMLTVLFSPFTYFSIQFPFVGRSPFHLFLLSGYLLFGYEIFIQKQSLTKIEKCSVIFLLLSMGWETICNVAGVWNYPYYSQINLTQMENFKNFYDNAAGVVLNELSAIKMWLTYKAVRSAIFDVFYAYFTSLWVYHLYKENWKLAFLDLRRILLVLCGILIFYSTFETDFLTGGPTGKSFLETVNPLYMKIAGEHGWWPRLLWDGQLRSLFCEPSFFGIFAAMANPIFFSFFYDKKMQHGSLMGRMMLPFLVIMLVLSKARTGTVLFAGEIFLLIFWQVFFHRKQWKSFFMICLCIIGGFFAGLGIMTQFQSFQSFDSRSVSVEGYMEENVTSITGNQRSNSARRANTRVTMQTGKEHPVFGVGRGMKDMYLVHHFTAEEMRIPEVVNRWTKYMYEKGPLKSSYPVLNQFAGVFAEQGIIGLLFFVFPIFYCIYRFLKDKPLLYDYRTACILIALCGLCVSFLANDAKIYFYVVMGYMLIAVHSDRGEKDE